MTTRTHTAPLRSGGFLWGRLRVSLGISIKELGRRAGINSGDLSKMENGRLFPRADEYERITAVLRDAEAAPQTGSTPAG